MRGRRWLCMAAVSVLLVACSGEDGLFTQPEQKSESEQLTPTGYPSGEIQRASVYYNGTLYFYTAEGTELPLGEGFERVGAITAIDNTEYPSEEFCASRLEVGQEVYGNRDEPDQIYVKYDGGFGLFKKDSDGAGTHSGRTGAVSENAISYGNGKAGR